jgi:S1-C subfamily serine protease
MPEFVLIVHGRHYPISQLGLRIGRDPENDVILADDGVSRDHARVWQQGTDVYVEDLDSTNGTFVNDVKISGPQSLRPNDRVQVGRAVIQLAIARPPVRRIAGLPLPVIGIGSLLGLGALIIVAVLFSLLGDGLADDVVTATPIPTTVEVLEDELLDQARMATVLVLWVDPYGYVQGGGSGGIVDGRGYILTNYHVIEGAASILIGTNSVDESKPARVEYTAEAVVWDAGLDIALLRIVSDEDGEPLSEQLSLPTLPLGDSDSLHIGDLITILGFPGVGGETVTLTRGSVSGFSQDELGHVRGWIKTDAEISPGNSGGVAINEMGELVGVPTYVTTEERTLGRLGGLRPLNLTGSILEAIP